MFIHGFIGLKGLLRTSPYVFATNIFCSLFSTDFTDEHRLQLLNHPYIHQPKKSHSSSAKDIESKIRENCTAKSISGKRLDTVRKIPKICGPRW